MFICMFHDWIRLDPRHDVNGFVHVMHYVNSIFHGMVSDALAAAVEQVDLHGHDVNGFVHVMHYLNSIFHVMVSDGLAAAVEQTQS